jgi:hypothetical protein
MFSSLQRNADHFSTIAVLRYYNDLLDISHILHNYFALYNSGVRVFSSCTFFLTEGVADVNAPSLCEIQAIVESGGGIWVQGTEAFIEYCRIRHANPLQPTAASSSSSKTTNKRNTKSSDLSESDDNKNVVILSSEAAYAGLGVHVRTAITSALQSKWVMGDGIYSLEVLFLAVLRQQLTFQSCNLLQTFQSSNNQSSSDVIEEKKKGVSKNKKAK